MPNPASEPPPTRPSLLPLSLIDDLYIATLVDETWDDEETTKVIPWLKEIPHARR